MYNYTPLRNVNGFVFDCTQFIVIIPIVSIRLLFSCE